MKNRIIQVVALRAAAALLVVAPAAQAGQIGAVYNRSLDWVPGTAGQISGVPGPSPAESWTYEWVSGGALGSANPWYRQEATPMAWDTSWYGNPIGVWARGDNTNPPIGRFSLVHNEAPSAFAYQPVVRWTDPAPGTAVNVTGNVIVRWSGIHGIGRPTDVDVVIARQNAARTVTTLLLSQTVVKPNAFPSVGDQVSIPVNISNMLLGQGESMLVTLRARNGQLSWVHLFDNLNISTIPAPSGVGALAMAGLVVARRRRR